MDNIVSIRKGNVYYQNIDLVSEHRVSKVCLEVKDVEAADAAIPIYDSITYRYALMSNLNTTNETQSFVLSLHGIVITPLLLEAIGFQETHDELPGIKVPSHFVVFLKGTGVEDVIRLVEVDGTFKLAVMRTDDSFTYCMIEKRLRYMHELQNLIIDVRHKQLHLELDLINHFFLFEQDIDNHLALLVDVMKETSLCQLDQIQKYLSLKTRPYTMLELKLILNYGFRKNKFKYPYIADNAVIEMN